jgi:hypothetical protein
MANLKISELPAAGQLNSGDLIPVASLNNDETYTTKTVTGAQLNAYLQSQLRAVITITTAGASITNDYFLGKPIFEIIANGLSYFRNVDFIQNDNITSDGLGNTITFTNGQTVYPTQIIVAKV